MIASRIGADYPEREAELFPQRNGVAAGVVREVVREVARQFGAVHVPLQAIFDSASKQASAEYWLWDGFHPTAAGHELIARQWIDCVSEHLQQKKTPCGVLFDKIVDKFPQPISATGAGGRN